MVKNSEKFKWIYRITNMVLLFIIANSMLILRVTHIWWHMPLCCFLFILINVFPSLAKNGYPSFRLRMCSHGSELLIYFLSTALASCILYAVTAFFLFPDRWVDWVIGAVGCIVTETVVFWNGMISVYLTSLQLGIRHRVIGLLCGWIPIANLFALGWIIKITSEEVDFENKKEEKNELRLPSHICRTKYPILMVHGVFFRDSAYFNYWGRVPQELERNGATLYYGNHESADSVEDCAKELAGRIKEIVEQTGCGKLNIIAHSKGGLDSRGAICRYGAEDYVASLTTINTPHRGCGFADYLLGKIPQKVQNKLAAAYNAALRKFGDKNPDFITAVTDLTEQKCAEFNKITPDSDKVYYQSVGSKLNHASSGKFPLNFSYHLVKHFDGENDGLVSAKSFEWGSNYRFVTTDGRRGISHGDMIDLNREDIRNFDVREFYVDIVRDLAAKGF